MTVITTSIGYTIVVRETMEQVVKIISDKDISPFTLIDGSSIYVTTKHIVHIKK